MDKKPLLILHFILFMKLYPILCFTNSRETAHRLEAVYSLSQYYYLYTILSCALLNVCELSISQTLSVSETLRWSWGSRVLLQTLSWWEEEDHEGVWTGKDPTVSLCVQLCISNMSKVDFTPLHSYLKLFSDGRDGIDHLSDTIKI